MESMGTAIQVSIEEGRIAPIARREWHSDVARIKHIEYAIRAHAIQGGVNRVQQAGLQHTCMPSMQHALQL